VAASFTGPPSYEDSGRRKRLIFAEAKARQLLLLTMSKGASTHTIQLAQDTLEMAEGLGEAGKPIQLHVLQGSYLDFMG
jgi:hypothetical protein